MAFLYNIRKSAHRQEVGRGRGIPSFCSKSGQPEKGLFWLPEVCTRSVQAPYKSLHSGRSKSCTQAVHARALRALARRSALRPERTPVFAPSPAPPRLVGRCGARWRRCAYRSRRVHATAARDIATSAHAPRVPLPPRARYACPRHRCTPGKPRRATAAAKIMQRRIISFLRGKAQLTEHPAAHAPVRQLPVRCACLLKSN
jgi:hypothetical protein